MADEDRPLGYKEVTADVWVPEYPITADFSPHRKLEYLAKHAKERGIPLGVKVQPSAEALFADVLARVNRMADQYPGPVGQAWFDSLPSDLLERTQRAYDQGFRSPGSRTMSSEEFRNLEPFESLRARRAMGAERLGTHTDMTPELIGPQAGHFKASLPHRVAIPLNTRWDPRTSLLVTDEESNKGAALASRLYNDEVISSAEMERVLSQPSEARANEALSRILRDNGISSLVYPNSVEGSPVSGSKQEHLYTNFGSEFSKQLERVPLSERAEYFSQVPNPSAVFLDPADVRHLYQAEFNPAKTRHIGYKLGLPAAGALATYAALRPGNAAAAESPEYKDLGERKAGRYKDVPEDYELPAWTSQSKQTIGPMPEGEFFGPVTERIENRLGKDFPRLREANDWLQQNVGMGLADLPMVPWAVELMQRPWERSREAVTAESLEPIKKLKDEVPNDVMLMEGAVKGVPYILGKAASKVKEGATAAKKRLGRIINLEPEVLDAVEVR